jgi:hypothetical protein
LYIKTLEDIIDKQIDPRPKDNCLNKLKDSSIKTSLWHNLTMSMDLDSSLPKILKAYFIHKAKAKYIEYQRLAYKQGLSHELIIKRVINYNSAYK